MIKAIILIKIAVNVKCHVNNNLLRANEEIERVKILTIIN